MKDVLKSIAIALVGNRINALAGLALITAGSLAASPKEGRNIQETEVSQLSSPREVQDAPWNYLIAGALGFGGILALKDTGFGVKTYRAYRATRKSIQNRGYLDRDFARSVIEASGNDLFMGYCEQQGMYLASREMGHEDTFHSISRKESNVILPHF